jgi:hypothetical protein
MEKMFQRYQDQVNFVAVYIREAHPTDGWRMKSNDRAGVTVEQPATHEQRRAVAATCCAALKMSMPLVVDEIDDRVGKAYSAFPDRLYLVDRCGRVAYRGGRGPFGYQPRELEQQLVLMLLEEHLAANDTPPAEE